MYKKSAGAGGAGAAGALATTGAPNVALYIGVAIVLSIIGLCLYRTSVVLGPAAIGEGTPAHAAGGGRTAAAAGARRSERRPRTDGVRSWPWPSP